MTQSTKGLWITDPAAYRKKAEALLGSRDPIEVLEQTPEILARLINENPTERMRSRPFADKWTPNEVIGHLVDAEWVFGCRMRLVLCEDQPTILGMDQDLWVSGQRHNERKPTELVETHRNLRRHNLALWKRMTPADLKRTAQHNERGRESLGTMLQMCAGHDLSHIDQITRYLEAAKKTT